MTPETSVGTSAPTTPVVVPPQPAPSTLREFRAQKTAPVEEPPAPPAVEPPAPPQALTPEEPTDPIDEVDEPPAQPETPKGPEPAAHRWKDPDTGVTLDMRRRDHRRIRRLLEERADYARQVATMRSAPAAAPPPTQTPPAPAAEQAPTLEDFADQPDPYRAYVDAAIAHGIKSALTQHETERARVERAQSQTAQIESAQTAWDAKLPEIRQRYPDFDAAYSELFETLAPMGRRSRPLVQYLLTAQHGHDVAHYLGNHPEAVRELFAHRSLADHMRAIGEITATVKGSIASPKPASPITPPAAPIAPVGGSATPVTVPDASRMNLKQFRAHKAKFGMRA